MEIKEKIIHNEIKIRISQMIINEEYKNGKFKIPIHLAFGHEAIATAIDHVMKDEDKLILTHRNIAYNLSRLNRIKPIMDEYFLKTTGLMNGKTGSMNLINPNKGIIYASSILGNNFAVAVGVAMGQKIKEKNNLTIVLGGDGSLEEGSFHESLMMFKSLRIPGFIIIENNEWSMSTKIEERRCDIDLQKFCDAENIKFLKLADNNPLEYIEKLSEMREYSISNNELVCIEIFVTTLGDWIIEHPEYPDGKFINYHAGPAPMINLEKCPIIIKEGSMDPIFVLKSIFDEKEIEYISDKVRSELKDELA